MRKRRVSFVLVGLLLVGALVALFTREHEREPEYGGKKLSAWVEGAFWLDLGDGRIIAFGGPNGVVSVTRSTGTNAVPFLLRWVRYEPPAWKTRSIQYINKVFRKPVLDDVKARRGNNAMMA